MSSTATPAISTTDVLTAPKMCERQYRMTICNAAAHGLIVGFTELHHPFKHAVLLEFLSSVLGAGTQMTVNFSSLRAQLSRELRISRPRCELHEAWVNEACTYFDAYSKWKRTGEWTAPTPPPHPSVTRGASTDAELTRITTTPSSDSQSASAGSSKGNSDKQSAKTPVKIAPSSKSSSSFAGRPASVPWLGAAPKPHRVWPASLPQQHRQHAQQPQQPTVPMTHASPVAYSPSTAPPRQQQQQQPLSWSPQQQHRHHHHQPMQHQHQHQHQQQHQQQQQHWAPQCAVSSFGANAAPTAVWGRIAAAPTSRALPSAAECVASTPWDYRVAAVNEVALPPPPAAVVLCEWPPPAPPAYHHIASAQLHAVVSHHTAAGWHGAHRALVPVEWRVASLLSASQRCAPPMHSPPPPPVAEHHRYPHHHHHHAAVAALEPHRYNAPTTHAPHAVRSANDWHAPPPPPSSSSGSLVFSSSQLSESESPSSVWRRVSSASSTSTGARRVGRDDDYDTDAPVFRKARAREQGSFSHSSSASVSSFASVSSSGSLSSGETTTGAAAGDAPNSPLTPNSPRWRFLQPPSPSRAPPAAPERLVVFDDLASRPPKRRRDAASSGGEKRRGGPGRVVSEFATRRRVVRVGGGARGAVSLDEEASVAALRSSRDERPAPAEAPSTILPRGVAFNEENASLQRVVSELLKLRRAVCEPATEDLDRDQGAPKNLAKINAADLATSPRMLGRQRKRRP